MSYSTQRVSTKLLNEIKTALHGIHYGSVEIYIQDEKVTQITVRNIKKTKLEIASGTKKDDNEARNPKSSLNQKIEVLTLGK